MVGGLLAARSTSGSRNADALPNRYLFSCFLRTRVWTPPVVIPRRLAASSTVIQFPTGAGSPTFFMPQALPADRAWATRSRWQFIAVGALCRVARRTHSNGEGGIHSSPFSALDDSLRFRTQCPYPSTTCDRWLALDRSGPILQSCQVARTPSRLWIKCRPDRTRRSRVRSTRENRRFSKWKKVMDDFFHGQLGVDRPSGDWPTPVDVSRLPRR